MRLGIVKTMSFPHASGGNPVVERQKHGCPTETFGHDRVKVMSKQYYVYILASKKNGTLYVGITSNLIKRIYEHKNNLVEGFTEKYDVHNLVYYEITESVESAINREKQIKKWNRTWKIRLIKKNNPEWKDLYFSLL